MNVKNMRMPESRIDWACWWIHASWDPSATSANVSAGASFRYTSHETYGMAPCAAVSRVIFPGIELSHSEYLRTIANGRPISCSRCGRKPRTPGPPTPHHTWPGAADALCDGVGVGAGDDVQATAALSTTATTRTQTRDRMRDN